MREEDDVIYRLFRAMAMLDSGIVCRTCGEGVARKDELGMSESVCAASQLAKLNRLDPPGAQLELQPAGLELELVAGAAEEVGLPRLAEVARHDGRAVVGIKPHHP